MSWRGPWVTPWADGRARTAVFDVHDGGCEQNIRPPLATRSTCCTLFNIVIDATGRPRYPTRPTGAWSVFEGVLVTTRTKSPQADLDGAVVDPDQLRRATLASS